VRIPCLEAAAMNAWLWIALGLALAVAVYVFVALLWAEELG